MFAHNERVVLEYEVNGVLVRESPWVARDGDRLRVTRTFEIDPRKSPLMLTVGETADGVQIDLQPDPPRIVLVRGDSPVTITATGSETLGAVRQDRLAGFEIPAGTDPLRIRLDYTFGDAAGDAARESPAIESLAAWTAPGERRWTAEIITQGVHADDDDATYVVDTITLPFDNPYGALFFVGGHDFFSDGRVALCTAHGDVWTVTGVDDDLQELHWRRFATGLFQPLGLKIVDDVAYVLGRDQITKLHDRNADGEADYYECFSNLQFTSAGGHDYVTCLEQDSRGGFWFVHGTQGVVRIAADGQELQLVATGLRNPNGMGLGPGDVVTAAPQEGAWTPASYIAVVQPGNHFGYKGPQINDNRPLGYDLPLCWIPRREDNSCGGQVWAPAEGWGPLSGLMLHLSYGQCRVLPVLEEQVGDTRQAGLYTLPLDFDSGIMRGRFSPHDGQLYVSGLRGWTTRAVTDGCLQRVRYTGKPAAYPVVVRTMSNGIALTFSEPLDPNTAQDPGNWFAEQWNYRYSEAYGSPDMRPSRPGQEGRDPVDVLSATILDDGRTVFVETPPLAPVAQLALRYRIESAAGRRLRQTYTHTLHNVPDDLMDPARLVRQQPAGALPDEIADALQPGLLWRFEQEHAGETRSDSTTHRMAALFVTDGDSPTSRLQPGPFRATVDGYISVDLSNDYLFAFRGTGTAKLAINGTTLLEASGTDVSDSAPVSVPLRKGYNQIAIEYDSPAEGNAQLQVLWRVDDGSSVRRSGLTSSGDWQEILLESIDPRTLSHRGDDAGLHAANQRRLGAELFATHLCARCHASQPRDTAAESPIDRTGPDLRGLDRRVRPEWVAAWVLDPSALRHDARMPATLNGFPAESRPQLAADITAWLFSDQNRGVETAPPSARTGTHDGNGRELFEELGCITCHHFGAPAVPDEYGRLSLKYAALKFPESGMQSFLANPQAHHRWSRMPDFRLTPGEAAALTQYVRESSTERDGRDPPGPPMPQGDAARGKELVGLLGCINCHTTGFNPQAAPQLQPDFADWTNGCLSNEVVNAHVPRFDFTDVERQALRNYLSDEALPTRSSAAETADSLIRELRCAACHDRDGEQSPRRLIIVDEGADGLVPDHLPTLTWAGEKLRADWMQRLFHGEINHPQRTWLPARMPAFPAYAELLANGLAAQHGLSPAPPAELPAQPELAEIGRELMLPAHLDCRQCHGVGSEQPRGDANTQIALGINFADVRARLRHDFYPRFVLDPPRFDVNIRMPRLAAEDGTTRVQSLLAGDATAQFEAIWQFIQSQPESARTQLDPPASE